MFSIWSTWVMSPHVQSSQPDGMKIYRVPCKSLRGGGRSCGITFAASVLFIYNKKPTVIITYCASKLRQRTFVSYHLFSHRTPSLLWHVRNNWTSPQSPRHIVQASRLIKHRKWQFQDFYGKVRTSYSCESWNVAEMEWYQRFGFEQECLIRTRLKHFWEEHRCASPLRRAQQSHVSYSWWMRLICVSSPTVLRVLIIS